jgi:hypothetical protein
VHSGPIWGTQPFRLLDSPLVGSKRVLQPVFIIIQNHQSCKSLVRPAPKRSASLEQHGTMTELMHERQSVSKVPAIGTLLL